MAKTAKKKSKKREYDNFGSVVTDFDITVLTGVNPEINERRKRHDEMQVWHFDLVIDLKCSVIWPEDRVGESLTFWLSGWERGSKWYEDKLEDRVERDQYGSQKYQRLRGKDWPIYNLPKGIGSLERSGKNEKGKPNWSASAWMKPSALRDMTSLLQGHQPVFIHLVGFKEGRTFWLTSVEMSLGDEDERALL